LILKDPRIRAATALKVLQRCIAIGEAHRKNRPLRAGGVAASTSEAYRLLSAVYLGLGDIPKAADAASRARGLDPLNPRGYRQSAKVHLANGNGEAAIALTAGFLVTSDAALREDLVNLYRSGLDTKGCGIAPEPNGPMMNPSCEMVHRLSALRLRTQ